MKKYLTPELEIEVLTAVPLCASGQEFVDFDVEKELDNF